MVKLPNWFRVVRVPSNSFHSVVGTAEMATSASTNFGNNIVEWLLDQVPESEVDALLTAAINEYEVQVLKTIIIFVIK